jgi:hypothetical protein
MYKTTKNTRYVYCELPRVKLREGPLPITLVPNTSTIMSTGLGQADKERLNIWLQDLLHIEAGISVEPQILPETKSIYITV